MKNKIYSILRILTEEIVYKIIKLSRVLPINFRDSGLASSSITLMKVMKR